MRFLVAISFAATMWAANISMAVETVHIGVTHGQAPEVAIQKWSPTAEYLSESIPDYNFEILPMYHNQLSRTLNEGELDLIILPSKRFINTRKHNLTPIATPQTRSPDRHSLKMFSTAVFFLKDAVPNPHWKNVRNRTIAATREISFDGWIVAQRELKKQGLRINKDYDVKFCGTVWRVIHDVFSGEASVGVVRADKLPQRLKRAGYNPDDISIIPCKCPTTHDYCNEFPYKHSTPFYPELVLAATGKTSTRLQKSITSALIQLEEDSPALTYADLASWEQAANYDEVEKCMRELRLGPFSQNRYRLLQKAIQENPALVSGVVLLLIVSTAGTLFFHLLNKRLRVANATIQEAAKLKGQFIANMSHEIRTPLNAIVGMTDLLHKSDLNHAQKEYADVIRTSSDALMCVIGDILDFSKIESGHLDLEEYDFSLITCLEDTLDLVGEKAAQKKIELLFDIDSDVPAVIRGDAARIRQILLNLLSNAIKFTSEGEVRLSVVAKTGPRGHEIHFSVRDSGIGIEPENLERIFHKFTQADLSTTRKYGGTGLGLPISRSLAEQMGGRLWAESTPGQGSTFHFCIHSYHTIHSVEISHAVPRKPVEVANRDVLVIDDNDASLKMLCNQLTRWGLNPIAFSDRENGFLSVKEGQQYALMICDMKMLGTKGNTLIHEIRQHEAARNLPVIALSQGDLPQTDDMTDITARLTKPVKSATLYQLISEILLSADHTLTESSAPCKIDPTLKPLVVEDNKLNQRVALRMLETLGLTADLAGDGIEGLEMVKQKTYDVILMDLQMPRMDGITTTREILKHYNGKQTPLIFAMTANADKKSRERVLKAGMHDYITKPVQLVKLEEALARASKELNDRLPAN
ncbi:response regulator [Verrucomicrobiota bacterium]